MVFALAVRTVKDRHYSHRNLPQSISQKARASVIKIKYPLDLPRKENIFL